MSRTARPTTMLPPDLPPLGDGLPTIWRRLKDLVLGERTANGAVALAIVIGFLHGWLKLKIRHPIATFLFDIPLLVALALVVPRMRSLGDWLPPGRASRLMGVFYGVVAVWFLLSQVLPWGVPIQAALAAVRGWVFSTLMFGLGYHIIHSRRQLHGYFILIILMAAATGWYATRQSLEEVEAMQAMDQYFANMTRGQAYVDDEGNRVLRRFSTFISSGAFGGTMAVSLLFLVALLTDGQVGKTEKMVLLVLGVLIGWGMNLSGARSALVAFGLGLVIIVWFRRVAGYLWMFGGAFAVALLLASRGTGGGIWDRLAQLLDPTTVWGRFYIVWAPGTRYLMESGFVGGGLGKAGVGLPVSLLQYMGNPKLWGVDGDLGKAMAEMGIVGVIVVILLLLAGLMDGLEIVKRQRDTSVGVLALGAFSCFAIAVVTFPIGSPFIGIPLGVLTWFFLGAVIKLDQIEPVGAGPRLGKGQRAETETGRAAVEVGMESEAGGARRFLHGPKVAGTGREREEGEAGGGRKRRYLYR